MQPPRCVVLGPDNTIRQDVITSYSSRFAPRWRRAQRT